VGYGTTSEELGKEPRSWEPEDEGREMGRGVELWGDHRQRNDGTNAGPSSQQQLGECWMWKSGVEMGLG